jgi:hypothetical protein
VGQNARYSFTATAGQNLSLAFVGPTFPGYWTYAYVFKPDGTQLTHTYFNGTSTTLDLANLPVSGTYSVFITPPGTATGTMGVRIP